MNPATPNEQGPVARYMNAEAENEHLKMLLVNLTTAACPYVNNGLASPALIEAHREASEALNGCGHCSSVLLVLAEVG